MNADSIGQLINATGVVLAAIITVTLPAIFLRLRETKAQLEANETTLRNLIIYRPGAIAYELLVHIRNRDNETYDDSHDDKKRCLNLLLDDGYLKPAPGIHYVYFAPTYNGRRLHEIVSLTPIAEDLVRLRTMIQDTNSAHVRP